MTEQWPHGGNLRKLREQSGAAGKILDFSANMNPLGFPHWLRSTISSAIEALAHYPDPECAQLREAAALRYHVSVDEVIAGNGSSELLFALPQLLQVRSGVVAVPCYHDYSAAMHRAGLSVAELPLDAAHNFELDFDALAQLLRTKAEPAMIILGRPNNPTGRSFSAASLRTLAAQFPQHWFVIDEAFADFIEGFESLTQDRPANVIVLLSQTKNFAVPGLRIGIAIAEAQLIAAWQRQLPSWSVNTLAQVVATRALGDSAYLAETRALTAQLRADFVARLAKLSALEIFPGEANFLLLKLTHPLLDVPQLAAKLLALGIAIRQCANFSGLTDAYFRLAVRTQEENDRLCAALETLLSGAPSILSKRPVPALMLQATSSNAGKSILTTALCRILLQDGYNVAPFKAQNMSLNSAVTPDGLELGRAQALQAQACRLEPDVRMNPVLLKPNSDTGSQVIVMGKPVANMEATEYFARKRMLKGAVHEAYDSLAAEHDAIVLEGAGSAAEVNLKAHDIVNMSMAFYAKAPVLIAGDIDRGGVFASFVGTMETFTEQERAQVAGFIVNRFRGQASLLDPALEYVRNYTGKPVLGVIPFLNDLGLPEEDSVSFKEMRNLPHGSDHRVLDVALVDLPHISNFTDCDALRGEPDVSVRIVRHAEELGEPHLVILPGSRNVPGDLEALRQHGMDKAILELAQKKQCEIVGICGGFQMLGRLIRDPHCLESAGDTVAGLNLLPVTTSLEEEKVLLQTRGLDLVSRLEVRGYEIHHGVTDLGGAQPLIEGSDGSLQGARSADGMVWGSYLHGIFDADEFRRAFLDRLRVRAGWQAVGCVVAPYDLEPALDRLADVVRAALPIDALYRKMGLR